VIAEESKKLILLSAEHQSAMREYLNLCELKQVMPLPILNKVQQF